jgi:hypothetical protein
MAGELTLSQFRYTTTNNRDLVIGDPTDNSGLFEPKYIVFQTNTTAGYSTNPYICVVYDSGTHTWSLQFSNSGGSSSAFITGGSNNIFTGTNVFDNVTTFSNAVTFNGTHPNTFNSAATFNNLATFNDSVQFGSPVTFLSSASFSLTTFNNVATFNYPVTVNGLLKANYGLIVVGGISGNLSGNATTATTCQFATQAGVVTTAAQPYITSVGIMLSLSVSGIILASGAAGSSYFQAAYSTSFGPLNNSWCHMYSALPFYFNQSITTTGQYNGSGAGLNGTAGNLIVGSANALNGPAFTNGSDGWFRSRGAAGWYNQDTGGGIYCNGSSTVQTYNGSSFIANGNLTATGTIITGPISLSQAASQGTYGRLNFNNGNWFIEGNSSYGLYASTGMYIQGGVYVGSGGVHDTSGNLVYSPSNPQISVVGSSGSCTGNAATATYATTATHAQTDTSGNALLAVLSYIPRNPQTGAANGYLFLSNGFIMQWGTLSPNTTYFTTPFPNMCLSVSIANTNGFYQGIGAISASSFATGSQITGTYIAFGY